MTRCWLKKPALFKETGGKVLSDKIASFEDYKNKAVTPEPVSQDTMNIEIEDPYQFLSAE